MRGYTASTIKKRDDGISADPYLARKPPKDWAVCSRCHAIYHNKHWFLSEKVAQDLLKNQPRHHLCPACQKIRDHFPSGVITLKGEYLVQHRGEIMNLVRNEEVRARGFNPLERIVSIREGDGTVEVETTTEKLAQRIGKRLHHAHQGKVAYRWSRDNHLIRVAWERGKRSPQRPG